MSTEGATQDVKPSATAAETKPAEATKPAESPQQTPAVEPSVKAQGQGGSPPASPAPESSPSDDDDDSDPTPDASGYIKMPFKSFDRRIKRAAKSNLKAIFGTDDRNAIIKMKTDWEEAVKKQDEERRAKLDEQTRLKEDLDRATKAREDAERRAVEIEERHIIEAQERAVTNIASRYVSEEYVEDVMERFAKHLRSLGDEKAEKFTDAAAVDAWFKDYVEKKPAFAKNPSKPSEPVKEQPKVPVTSGASPAQKPVPPASGSAETTGKTASPGKTNSMSKAELDALKKARGLQW